MPLSAWGLCDAVITMPASARRLRVTYATPGVGSGPMNRTSTPMDRMPDEMAFSSMYPDKRVSLPSTILCRPRPRACVSRFLNTCPAARPSFNAVSAVTGSIFAVPRTPSVPKIFLGELMRDNSTRRFDHFHFFRHDLNDGDIGMSGDADAFVQAGAEFRFFQFDQCADVVRF